MIMLSFLAGCSVQNTYATETDKKTSESTDQEMKPVKVFDAEEHYERLLSCVDQLSAKSDFKPDAVLVLGSGLWNYADQLDIIETIPYEEIDDWPTISVSGHSGNL